MLMRIVRMDNCYMKSISGRYNVSIFETFIKMENMSDFDSFLALPYTNYVPKQWVI